MDIYQSLAIGLYFLLMILIGLYAYRKSTSNVDEFLLGGRKLGPAVTALSAGAADMSGWLLMGLPGAMLVTGISASWIAIGLTIGAYLNYLFVAPPLRVYTERANNAITLPDFFEKRFRDKSRTLRLISGLVIIVFFTLYTSAGMVSGGKLFESAFNVSYHTGLLITSSIVVFYTFVGGFLAVSLTDFVQGTIMVIALIMVPTVVFFDLGGVGPVFNEISARSPDYLSLFHGTTFIGAASLFAWGLGYCGQPHILVRFMAIDKVKQLNTARRIGISWMIFTVGGAMLVGLVGIAYTGQMNVNIGDPETIFIYFAKVLFHPFIGGFLLSAILAAIMSTISSQLLVTSSSVTQDFYNAFLRRNASPKELLLISRLSVVFVAIVSYLLSITPNDSILNLVGHAWAGFGSSFGPALVLSLLWKRTTKQGVVAGMIVGGLTVLLWTYLDHPLKSVYSMIPGFSLSLLAVFITSHLTRKPSDEIQKEFGEVRQILKEQY
jgi:SSS family solute:Na+ symporter